MLPLAALTRGQFEKFRTGIFENVRLRFEETWTMDDSVQPLFPVPSCVVFTTKRRVGQQMADRIVRRAYSGTLPFRDAPEDIADKRLKVDEKPGEPTEARFAGGSVYRAQFRQGATLVPRFLCFVERRNLGALGSDPNMPFVVSRRSTQEKQPWKMLPGLEGRVEREFLRPVLLGESILPYRVWRPFEGIIPVTERGEVVTAQTALNRGYQGIAEWLREADELWRANANEGSKLTITEQFDYYGKLSAQFPIAPLRMVYAKAGTQPAACVVNDDDAVIDHMLYWISPGSPIEAGFLSAIFNSETGRKRVEEMQSKGQWGARHFDKVMFNLPIPRFDPANALHGELSASAAEAEEIAAAVIIPEAAAFQRARRIVRDALMDAGVARRIDALVARLLDGG